MHAFIGSSFEFQVAGVEEWEYAPGRAAASIN
jgi:hypothetical protein